MQTLIQTTPPPQPKAIFRRKHKNSCKVCVDEDGNIDAQCEVRGACEDNEADI